MNTWINFAGKKYYPDARSFVKEAQQDGCTRRVAPKTLQRMAFGDRVVMAIMEGNSAVLIGEFPIEKISGLSEEATAKIAEKYEVHSVDSSLIGKRITRGCGEYIIGFVFQVDASIEQIAEALEECDNPGLPMVGGPFTKYQPIRMTSMRKYTPGFRLFDWATFSEDLAIAEQKNRRMLHGYYYDKPGGHPTTVEGLIEVVSNYAKAK